MTPGVFDEQASIMLGPGLIELTRDLPRTAGILWAIQNRVRLQREALAAGDYASALAGLTVLEEEIQAALNVFEALRPKSEVSH